MNLTHRISRYSLQFLAAYVTATSNQWGKCTVIGEYSIFCILNKLPKGKTGKEVTIILNGFESGFDGILTGDENEFVLSS